MEKTRAIRYTIKGDHFDVTPENERNVVRLMYFLYKPEDLVECSDPVTGEVYETLRLDELFNNPYL